MLPLVSRQHCADVVRNLIAVPLVESQVASLRQQLDDEQSMAAAATSKHDERIRELAEELRKATSAATTSRARVMTLEQDVKRSQTALHNAKRRHEGELHSVMASHGEETRRLKRMHEEAMEDEQRIYEQRKAEIERDARGRVAEAEADVARQRTELQASGAGVVGTPMQAVPHVFACLHRD